MRLGRPVGLGLREPVRKESDHELRRMHPAMHHAIDRRQAERRAKLIHRPLERAIDQEPVREAEERPLEPHRLGRRDPDVAGHALIDQAADDARLQVNGRRRHAEPFLRDARAERDAGRGDDGVGVRMPLDVPVDLGHRRQDCPSRDDLEPFARMPQIGVGYRRARILDRAHRQESQSLSLDQFLKKRIGQDGGPMPAALKRDPERDDRMDVTGAADGRQQHLEPPIAFQQSRRVPVCCRDHWRGGEAG